MSPARRKAKALALLLLCVLGHLGGVAAQCCACPPPPSPPRPPRPPPRPPRPPPSKPSPPPPVPGCLGTCPSSPTADCDFFIQGSPSSIPSFTLGPGASGEQLLGSVLVNSGTAIALNINTGFGCATVSVSGGTSPAGTTGNQFYTSGRLLYARTFNNPPLSAFVPNCVKLFIDSAQLQTGPNAYVNLNAGVPNADFPEARRCILFRITA